MGFGEFVISCLAIMGVVAMFEKYIDYKEKKGKKCLKY